MWFPRLDIKYKFGLLLCFVCPVLICVYFPTFISEIFFVLVTLYLIFETESIINKYSSAVQTPVFVLLLILTFFTFFAI